MGVVGADEDAAAIEARMGKPSVAADDNSPFARQMRAMQYQMDHMHEFPVLLIVCGLRDWPFKVPEEERVGLAPPNYGAVYPCVQNILLACRALGLGAALTTMHQVFEDELHEHFGVPQDHGVIVAIPIGLPMGRFGPVTRRPASEVTYFDAWGNLDADGWMDRLVLLPGSCERVACTWRIYRQCPGGGHRNLIEIMALELTAQPTDDHAWLDEGAALERLAHEELKRTVVRAAAALGRAAQG